jgi:hypothetical protein
MYSEMGVVFDMCNETILIFYPFEAETNINNI